MAIFSGGGGKTVNYLLTAIFAVVGAMSAQAADWTGADGNEYTALKSITGSRSGTAGAWIVTDITPSGTDIVKTKFRLNNLTYNQGLWCARTKNSGTDNKSFCGFLIYKTKDNQVLRFDRNGAGSEISGSNPGTSSDCTVVANYSTRKVSINGGTETTFGATGTYTVGSVLMLFGSNDGSNVISDSLASSKVAHKGSYTLYYFQLYTSAGVLKHNLVPAKNASGKAGVYDTVTGKFYPQASNSDSDFTQTARTAMGQGRKWTGRGGDNLMSNPANWEGNTLPAADEDLDLTLAPPLAEIVADLDDPHVAWLAGENQPTFTGDGVLTTYPVSRSTEWIVDDEKIVVDGATIEAGSAVIIGNASGSTGEIEVNCGSVTAAGEFYIGNGSKSKGTLTINGGTVNVNPTKQTRLANNGSSSTINLNSGVLETKRILRYDGTGSGSINFNGGTLRANEGFPDLTAANTEFIKNGITVTVGEGGGTIDNGGYNIKTEVSNITGSGGLVFRGSGTTTLGKSDSISSSYSGVTSIERGTTLVAYKADAQKILTRGVALIGTPVLNTPYTLMTAVNDANWDELTNFDKDHVMCPAAAEYTIERVKNAEGDKYNNTIVVTVTALNPAVWTGAKDNNLSDPGNWADGVVPTSGNATIFCPSVATLVVGDTFAPSAITFAANSAPVTIDGRDLTGIVAVTNLSSASHTINAKVYFAGDIQVKQNADYFDNRALSHVTFAGGAYAEAGCSIETGSTVNWSRCMFGKYYLANAENNPWTVTAYDNCRPMLAAGSELHVPYAGNLQELVALDDADVYVGNLAINAGGRLSKWIRGSMTVTNLVASQTGDVYISSGQGIATPGTFKFNSVTNGITGNKAFYFADSANPSKHLFFIGEGGLGYSSSATVFYIGRNADNNYETIRPWYSDFTIGHRGGTDIGLRLRRDVEFCTDDESGTGRTITVDAITCAQETPTITISGKGTLKINKAAQNTVQPPVTVKDTATLEYAAGASLGTGALTLGAGTTLVIASSDLPISVASLSLPESGTATIQIAGDALAAGDYAIIASAAGLPAGFEEKVNVVAPDGTSVNQRLYTSDNGTMSLFVGEGDLPDPYTWTGAANDGKMNTPGNWRGNAVPPAGATVFIPPTAGALDNNIENFAPASITFGYGPGEVTIGGNDITGVAAVTNLSTTASHTINAKVYFAGNIQVKQDAMGGDGDLTKAHVTFAGGAYAAEGCTLESGGTDPTYSRCIFGEYFLANGPGSPWTVTQSTGGNGHRRNSLAPDSILHVPYAGSVSTIYIGTNAKIYINSQTTGDRLSYRNYGEMIVTNLTASGTSDQYASHSQATTTPGVFKFDSVTNALDGKWMYFANADATAAKHTFYIGEGGLNFESGKTGAYCLGRDTANNSVTVRPWYSDFTISGRSDGKMSLALWRGVEFCTDDEEGTGRTITIDTPTRAGNPTVITVSGNGTLKVNKAASENGAEPPITLKDSATLEYTTADATLGTGTITLGAGTTFAFKNTGRELLLPSTIALPATGTATLRIDGAKLQLGKHEILASGATADSVNHLTVTGTAIGGRDTQLRVEDGKLILEVFPKGMTILIL